MSEIKTMLATIPVGDPDLGGELECEITYRVNPGTTPDSCPDYVTGAFDPGSADEVEFIKAEPYCNGKPSPYYGAFADLEYAHLQDIAADWLENVHAA